MDEVKITDVIAVNESEGQLFDIQIATAKKYPRKITQVIENAIATVVRNEKTAATCRYVLPRGQKKIEGPSIHLARIIAQFYGNFRVESRAGDIKGNTVTAQAVAFDLETNYAKKAESTRKILDKYGNRYNEDMINTTMLAAMSIAERNAILSVIPKAIVDEVYEAAIKAITGDLSDKEKLAAKRKEVVNYFEKKHGVTESEILKIFGKTQITQLTPDNIATLRGIDQAIKDGDTTVDQAFERDKKVDKDKAKDLFDGTGKTN